MTSYELAKKLKDAGFPQYEDFILSADDVNPRTAYNRKDHRTFDLSIVGYPKSEPDYYDQGKWRPSCIFSKQYLESDESETLYFPTLEELIEACGDGFSSLHSVVAGFRADGHKKCGDECENSECGGYRLKECLGKNPSEAVANLWLELNKK